MPVKEAQIIVPHPAPLGPQALPVALPPSTRWIPRIAKFAAYRKNQAYLLYERLLARLGRSKNLRVLISDKLEWKDEIAHGFQGSRHQVQFGPIENFRLAKFDVVVPMEIPDLIRASQSPELSASNPIPIPTEESVSLCDDKFKFNQAMIDRGFGPYIPGMMQGPGLALPYILKKRISYWGVDCHVIRTRDEEWQVCDQIRNTDFYCQEIVPGSDEFATHILFAKGRIVKSLNIKYKFEVEIPIKGRDPWLYKAVHGCPYLNLFSDVLKSIDFQGLCCVNYKVVQGRPYILEINPRFGGSLSPYFFSFMRHLDIR